MDFVQRLFLSVMILGVSKLVTSQTCEKLSACSCRDGNFTFDLSPLIAGGVNPRFSIIVSPENYTYTFQPCGALRSCGTSGTAAACQQMQAGAISYVLGDYSTAAFTGSPWSNSLELGFSHGDGNRITVIKMVCKSDGEAELKYTSEKPVLTYNFELLSLYACTGRPSPTPTPTPASHKISTGSVLLILFFVFLFVYFVAGMLFLKFARGAVGTEMVPNYGFWSSLPGYIKDGVVFTCSGCKSDTSYAKI